MVKSLQSSYTGLYPQKAPLPTLLAPRDPQGLLKYLCYGSEKERGVRK